MKNRYTSLERALNDLRDARDIYAPSLFWKEASETIANEIIEKGIENFRSIRKAQGFFVPMYRRQGNVIREEIADEIRNLMERLAGGKTKPFMGVEEFLSGHMQALADYRVFRAADNPEKAPYLHEFTECNFGNPDEQIHFEGRAFSRSALNYILGLSFLKKHLDGDVPKVLLEVGGGFGSLGEIFLFPGQGDLKYIDIDIPPIGFVAEEYLKHAVKSGEVATYEKTADLSEIKIDNLPAATVLAPWQIEKLVGKIDLFINFFSFQEMEPHIVENYLMHVDRLCPKWICLRNMREGKQVKKTPDGIGVEKPILGDDYPKMLPNYSLIESNVIPFGAETVDGFHSELYLFKRKA